MDRENVVRVLSLIAEGRSYEQIVSLYPDLTYKDVFRAAEEAVKVISSPKSSYQVRLGEIKRQHPRAYEKWTEIEEDRVRQMHTEGKSDREIADELHRQPSAISSRIPKLGLT